ncbi:MAG: hypothetical protein LPH21_02530 [Shewanella sp.]|nr:hypothetical protein [Shewanella sp.]MCF1456471.1 hypothetical protein [Shewanella sp.]
MISLGIPFGQNKDKGEWQDVAEVARGIACNCICPSCKLPLTARQGTEREWHFAHYTKNVPKSELIDCEYSFYASVRMMIHHMFRNGARIKLPDYAKRVQVPPELEQDITPLVAIAKAQSVNCAELSPLVDCQFAGFAVDALFDFGKYKLIVYITYPNRNLSVPLEILEAQNCGAVILNLEQLARDFYHKPMTDDGKLGTARQQLQGWLENHTTAKSWFFHPREQQRMREKQQVIADNMKLVEAEIPRIAPSVPPHKLRKLQCIGCGKIFPGVKGQTNPCPKCRTHLYSVEV